MCRMCVVEIDTGRGPALQPACMIPVAPGMAVDTESEVTKKAQDGVLEFLLINHPLDCPVCDKGGECPLQDQTLSYGPGESRFVEEKRHFEKPIMISDLVALDRERCILCDRCTRFAKRRRRRHAHPLPGPRQPDAGQHLPRPPLRQLLQRQHGADLPGRARSPPRPTASRPARGTSTRSESTCTTCSVGCRTLVQSSRNEILRYQGVDVDPVNWGWLCDKGRFGFGSVEQRRPARPSARPPRRPPSSRCRGARPCSTAADALRAASPDKVAVLGGARLTNESAYAWAKLAKGVIGTDHVDAQLGDGLPAEVVLGLPRATIDEVCAPGGTVLLLAPDLKEELPVLFLRLRHAVVRDGVTVVELALAAHLRRPSWPPPRCCTAPAPPARSCERCSPAPPPRRSAASSRTPSPPPGRSWPRARSPWSSVGRTSASRPTASSRRPRPSTPPTPRCASSAPCAAATCTAPSTWASPPGSCPGRTTLADGRRLVPRARLVDGRPPPVASTPPGSWRPPPTARSTCSCCSAPTRSPTSPTPTSPPGPSPAPAP